MRAVLSTLLLLVGCGRPATHTESVKFGLGLDASIVVDASPTDSATTQPTYYVLSLDAAVAAQQAVDLALGYPKPGVDIGGGIHVPPDASITVTYAKVQPSATVDGGYIYPADPVTKPILLDSAIAPQLPAPVTPPSDGGAL